SGESVPESERASQVKIQDNLSASSSTHNLPNIDKPAAAAATASAAVGATAAEKLVWEEEKMKLYEQLDDKDDEINNQAQLIEKLKEQNQEQEEVIMGIRRERDSLQVDVQRMQTENESSKDEVKEVLQALEELAVNYDQKSQEVETRNKENDSLNEELQKRVSTLQTLESELHQLKESNSHQRKRVLDMMMNLMKDLSDIGSAIGSEFKVRLLLILI
ncbi:hypothetical protein HELRODRAFT_76153, partial [Helobdella robusta]|uniref:Uncharacterized protein n=1 Tax=Helobdella robusta TaxID=6412 RepID=T1G2F8_HELRO